MPGPYATAILRERSARAHLPSGPYFRFAFVVAAIVRSVNAPKGRDPVGPRPGGVHRSGASAYALETFWACGPFWPWPTS